MPKILQHRRDTTAGLAATLGAEGEFFYDTEKKTIVVMDGTTTGGVTLARVSDIVIASTGTTTSVGLVRADNTSITINNGILSANISTATTTSVGLVRPDNSSITINNGVISQGSSVSVNWTMHQVGNGLVFYFNGTPVIRFSSTGTITAINDITAFGTIP